MYVSFLNGRALVLAALCLLAQSLNGQLRAPFTHLNLPEENTGFFFPQSYNTTKMPNPFSDTTSLTASQCAALFMSMGRASLDSTHVLADFSGFREHKDSVAHSEGCYSIALLDLLYYDFHPNALVNGWIYRENGEFYHTAGCTDAPCAQYESMVLWVDAPHISSKIYHFVMSAASLVSNYDSSLDSLYIDFDDGLGWQMLHTDYKYTVDYSAGASDRIVRCKLHRNGYATKFSACVLKSDEEYDVCGSSSFPEPNLPPWSSSGDNPWDVQTETDGESVKGRAYTLMSEDGLFDRPFIFVEGIDFGLDRDGHPIHDWTRHGTFGWCEFTSGFQDPDVSDDIVYGYDDLQLMPELLQQIRAEGYDIVLIDFHDGATWLQHNSALVQHVIRLCNEHKTGQQSMVVAGASMGGVISRHALRTMELNDEEHCARLWISMDAPHEGAHIPLALQYAIRFSADHGQEQAQLFRERYLLRPAAMQMLDVQVFHSMVDYDAWYGPLHEMGYPQNCRSIAISNGMGNGEGLSYASDELMDWECSSAGLNHSKFLLLPESGDPDNSLSVPGAPLLAHFRAPLVGWDAVGDEWYYWFGFLILGVVDLIDVDEELIYIPEGMLNRDYAPGGKRNTIQTFATAMNGSIAQMESANGDVDICSNVSPDDYNASHAFVLTQSAVGIVSEDPYVNVEDYLWEHPDENHFDRVWFAQSHNENHTELTDQNVMVVLEEVLATEHTSLDTMLTANSSNGGVFNYGRPEFPYLTNVHVHNGGRLHVNAMVNTHFNESSDYLSQDYHFEATTLDCTPITMRIDNDGELHVGDVSEEYRTGQITIGRDSRLIIGSNGKLTIHPGSSVIIEEGGILEIMPGGMLECVSGTMDIRAGGSCVFNGVPNQSAEHTVALSGHDSRWLFSGGQLHIAENTCVSNSINVEETGYLEVNVGTENMLHLEENAKLHLKGMGYDDEILRIQHGAHLQNANWMLGTIELTNGRVDLTHNGAIYTDARLEATQVWFYANDQWEAEGSELWVWSNGCTLTECHFEHVQLHTQFSKCLVMDSKFAGPNSGFDAQGGMFAFNSTHFIRAEAVSEGIEITSSYNDCVFADDSYIRDWSDRQLYVRRCLFSNTAQEAIKKQANTLTLECNQFEDCGGIAIVDATLDMSTEFSGGKNAFHGVDDCISLENAQGLWLEAGRNDFSGCVHSVIQGTMDTLCDAVTCELEWPATGNFWGYSNGNITVAGDLLWPQQNLIHLTSSDPQACGGYEYGMGCTIALSDKSPADPVNCDDSPKAIVPTYEDEVVQRMSSNTHLSTSLLMNGNGIEIFDMSGRRIYTGRLNAVSDIDAATRELSQGLYVLVMQTEYGPQVRQWFNGK